MSKEAIKPETPEVLFYQDNQREEKILEQFSPEQAETIKAKQKILSSLAYFIGRDFSIPVELNDPGAGWHWDFKANIIRIDPKDLLEKPMDFLRFVIAHEGGHRRISRTEFIPMQEWQEKGFSFLMNSIEDPRDNNFVADNYPVFADQMAVAYEPEFDIEEKSKDKALGQLGYTPRFMQAGFEYIKQWYRQRQNQDQKISPDLPPEVQAVLGKTLESASRSWWLYPAKAEADESEDTIKRYAQASYRVNREEIWPEFKKLVEQDLADQKMEEFIKDMQKEQAEGSKKEPSTGSIPQELKDKLTPEEVADLESALDKAMSDQEAKGEAGEQKESASGEPKSPSEAGGRPIPLDSLPPELKQKIKDFIESLPEDQKKELAEKAAKALADFEKELNEEVAGKLADSPEKKEAREQEDRDNHAKEPGDESVEEEKDGDKIEKETARKKSLSKLRSELERIMEKDQGAYEKARREVMPIVNKLTDELREIFRERRKVKHEAGHKSGPKISIVKRIREIAKGILPMESRAWEKREAPAEKDYAISLLVDLSGSMRGEKITETFKAVVVLAEVLNKLSVMTEILGFNDRLYEYQKFKERLSPEIRSKMGTLASEVQSPRAEWNDDGWALGEASARLAQRREREKFLVVLSDGIPEPSSAHGGLAYDLSRVIEGIEKTGEQKLVGLGIGPNTDHVAGFYRHHLANVGLAEMASRLADLLKELIVDYDKF
ncbi:MAG: hypothetical protein WCW56_02415 [Candidatus Paceibacterota bacterium]